MDEEIPTYADLTQDIFVFTPQFASRDGFGSA
jgi:hypothetical protein